MSEKVATTAEAVERKDPRGRILGIAGYVAKLPRGSRAELRRLRVGTDHVPPEPFWRIVDRYGIETHEELFWLRVIPLMVEHEHRKGVRAGAALSQAGVSSARLERWLRLGRSSALAEARRLLSKVDSGFDWPGFGTLLLYWNDRARMAFARDFFLASTPVTPHDTQSTKGDE